VVGSIFSTIKCGIRTLGSRYFNVRLNSPWIQKRISSLLKPNLTPFAALPAFHGFGVDHKLTCVSPHEAIVGNHTLGIFCIETSAHVHLSLGSRTRTFPHGRELSSLALDGHTTPSRPLRSLHSHHPSARLAVDCVLSVPQRRESQLLLLLWCLDPTPLHLLHPPTRVKVPFAWEQDLDVA
jgi:hypothetical protein